MRAQRALAAVRAHPRHLLLFAFTAGLLLGPLSPPATLAAATAAVLVALAAASPTVAPVVPRPSTVGAALLALAAAGAVLLGGVVAELRTAAVGGGRLPQMHGRPLSGRAVLLEPVRERETGIAVARARLVGGPARGEAAVLRVRSGEYPGAWPGVGDIVQVDGRVAPLGRYDAYQHRRGAGAAVDVARLRATGLRRGGPAGLVDGVRRRAEAGLGQGLPPAAAALLRGMVLGQDERLTGDVRDAFERSGLAHVLAVSGQNVMLLATLVLAAGALTGLGLRARLVLALALVALYVPLTGAGPSIQRAGVMGAAGLVAALAGRPAHRWYALGLAAAVTLTLNPLAAGEPGWQLSFAAVIALLAIAPPLRGALARRLPGPVADVAAITLAATLGTAPLMALHFEQVSLASLPANLLAAAAIAPIMWLGMLAAAAAQVAPVLAAPLNAANAPLLALVEWIAHTMAAAPLAVLPVRLGSPAMLAAAYAALAVALLAVRALWRRAEVVLDRASSTGGGGLRPGAAMAGGPRPHGIGVPMAGGPRPGAAVRLLLTLAAVAAAVLAAGHARDGPAPPVPGELLVSFLDVGQGDATLLQRDGASILVDTGPPDGPVLRRLEEAGVERLDALVITHAQADHEGAALAVMRAYPPRIVVNAGAGWPTAVQRALPAAIRAARARRLDAHAGQVLALAGIRLRVLWPPPPGPAFRPAGDPNDRALVAHVRSGDFDLLLPADAESDVTAALDLPPVEALKVAHHGSVDDGLPAMLERTRPAFATIEVGSENSYGHPAPSTLAALTTVDHVFRTDRDGTVRLRVHGGRMRWERARGP